MILFNQDWERFPNAIADYSTKNETFLRMAKLYQKMGVKNHSFLLCLMQPELRGIDPHDPTLSDEIKFKVGKEARFNLWYFIREVVKIPVEGGTIPKSYIANRANISMSWSWLAGIDYASIMPRQSGKSVGSDILDIWVLQLAATNTTVQLLTKDNDLRKKNIERMKAIRDLLPSYLNFTTRDDADNKETLTCLRLGNSFKTAVPRKSPKDAEKVGRGLTSRWVRNDEGPYCDNIHISLPVALASGTAAREEKGVIQYGNLFTTTAGKKDTPEGEFFYNLIHNGMYWNEKLLDCVSKEDAKDYVTKHCSGDENMPKTPIINGTFSHRQIGKSDEWLQQKISEARQSKEQSERDFLNKWTSGTIRSPLSTKLNDIIRAAAREPIHVELFRYNYTLNWYIPKEKIDEVMARGKFVISLDSSNMIGQDANGMLITDIRTMTPIASSNISEAIIHRYSEWVAQLLLKYPHTTLIPENKSTGQSIIDFVGVRLIQSGINPFTRIFNNIIDQPEQHKFEFKHVINEIEVPKEETFLKYKKKFGFQTTGNSRDHLYFTVLQRAAKDTGHLVWDRKLSAQILGLVEKNGRVDHQAGSHDDMVIAWLLVHWFSVHAVNIKYYGIGNGVCQSMVAEDGAVLTPEKIKERDHDNQLRDRITQLEEIMSTTKSVVERYKCQKEIEVCLRDINDSTLQASLNAVLEQSKKESKRSLRDALQVHQAQRR